MRTRSGSAVAVLVLAAALAAGLPSPGRAWAEEAATRPDEEEEQDEEPDDVDDVVEAPVYESVARASRPAGSASERRVSSLALRTAPRRSAEDLLRLVPGLLIVQHGAEGKGHQVFLRGFDAAHGSDVEVLVAGLPVNMLSNVHGHGYLDLNFLPAQVVESVEVLPGSFDAMQGDLATAGSLRLVLGVPEEARGTRLGYEGGLTNRHGVFALHAPPGPARHFAAAELLTDDGFGESRWSRRASFVGRIDGGALGGGPEVTVGLYAGEFGSPSAIRVDDYRAGRIGFLDSYTDDLAGRAARVFLAATQRLDLGASRLRLVAGTTLTRFDLESNYTGFLQHGERGDTRRQRHDAVDGYLSGAWEMGLAAGSRPLRIRAAAEWRGLWFRQDDAMILLPSREPWQVGRDALGGTNRLGLAASVFWAPLDWLQAEAGLRGDLVVIDFEDRLDGGARYREALYALSPRARLRLPLSRDWTLFASYGRGFRSPEARAVAVPPPNEDVDLDLYAGGRPEVTVSDAVEAGARFCRGGRLEANAAAFATFIDNETVFDHVSGTNLALNATRRLGGEVGLVIRPLPWLEARADLTAVDARFVESGSPVPGAPWLLATAGLSAAHASGLSGSLSFLYVAPRPLAHGATGSHQVVVDLAAAWRWRFVEVRLEIENLIASDRMEGEYHFASWFDRSSPRSLIPVTHYTAGPPFSLRAGVIFWI